MGLLPFPIDRLPFLGEIRKEGALLMYNLDKAYSRKFFSQRRSLNWRISIFCEAILDTLCSTPYSVIDFGCGNGDLVKGFLDRGIRPVFGVEGTENCLGNCLVPDEMIMIADLRIPFGFSLNFDLGVCLETAEHIEHEYESIFLKNITDNCRQLLFSAAPPGQGGIHHHNCKPQHEWIEDLNRLGMVYTSTITNSIREKLLPWKDKKGIKAYYQNLLYFKKEKACVH